MFMLRYSVHTIWTWPFCFCGIPTLLVPISMINRAYINSASINLCRKYCIPVVVNLCARTTQENSSLKLRENQWAVLVLYHLDIVYLYYLSLNYTSVIWYVSLEDSTTNQEPLCSHCHHLQWLFSSNVQWRSIFYGIHKMFLSILFCFPG